MFVLVQKIMINLLFLRVDKRSFGSSRKTKETQTGEGESKEELPCNPWGGYSECFIPYQRRKEGPYEDGAVQVLDLRLLPRRLRPARRGHRRRAHAGRGSVLWVCFLRRRLEFFPRSTRRRSVFTSRFVGRSALSCTKADLFQKILMFQLF